MTRSRTAIDELVSALLERTEAGSIRWHQADAHGRAFIAKRKSGTVVLRGEPGPAATGPFRLIVQDRMGNNVDEATTGAVDVDSPLSSYLSGEATAAGQLPALYEAVRAQLTDDDRTVRSLTEEFRSQTG
jgi:hypothetical protein